MRTTSRQFPLLIFASLAIPLAGYLVSGTRAMPDRISLGGLVRLFFVHQVARSVTRSVAG